MNELKFHLDRNTPYQISRKDHRTLENDDEDRQPINVTCSQRGPKAMNAISKRLCGYQYPGVIRTDRTGVGYSHSMVAGGLELISYTTRLMPCTSFVILLLTFWRRSYGRRAQSAVIASSLTTARRMIGCA